ncbi:hypothetical protein Mal64_22650 [Pseudobythopirellula maris]|uniref:Uncharacterized protein n=1 Tax=Pseudobythopirellula maris TaxID=2527991 RepID=A0A5C5ZPG7_9BACT|nr:hypothetical protein [Pseudobythopirellula maris]TWT88777.1 hypothetical protein Mal64_22650 [Pseudobythopirellula maris]
METRPLTSLRARLGAKAAFAAAALACAGAAIGCNNGQRLQGDLYQRELRLQEDEIYRLEDYIEEYQALLREQRCENTKLKRELKEAQEQESKPTLARDPDGFGDEPRGLSEPFELFEDGDEDPIPAPPQIEFRRPEPTSPPPSGRPLPGAEEIAPPFEPGAEPTEEAPPFVPGGTSRSAPPAAAEQPAVQEADAQKEIALLTPVGEPELFPTPAATRLELVAAAPPRGASIRLDDRLRLVVANGPAETTGESTLLVRTVAPAESAAGFDGEASLMLRDPSATRGDGKIARWDYSPQEVATLLGQDSAAGEPIEFRLVLPERSPTGVPLTLWVRFVDSAGHKTISRTTIELEAQAGPDAALRLVESTPAADPPSPVEPASFEAPADAMIEWRSANAE